MFNFLRALRFLNYTFFAHHKRGAGIHSPFVFALIADVFNRPVDSNDLVEIEKLRKDLSKKKEKIHYKDPGAGSRIKRKSSRSIGEIVRTSSTQRKYGELLFKLVREFMPGNIIEIGTSLGLGSMYLATGNSKGQVHTIEGAEPLYQLAKSNFEMAGFENIHIYNDLFSDGLTRLERCVGNFDMVFFDGNHTYNHTLEYFEMCIPKTTNESIFIFDDIHWSAEMERLWDRIITDERVVVSIDLFQLGLVFFRKELSKQHFVIKY
ncbi:MAG: class I SAM-dependent methyltransferase [Bacteroidota bacterium]|nr:class I SAM-dependent methyltransferase [Bacteroidota bacterium]